MKLLASLIILLFSLVACSGEHDEIIGTWSVKTNHYSAEYRIQKSGKGFDCRVLKYKDGTTIYNHRNGRPIFLFKGIKWKNGTFIDGVSGATDTKRSSSIFDVRLLNNNTLEVSSKLTGQSKTETWNRIKTNI